MTRVRSEGRVQGPEKGSGKGVVRDFGWETDDQECRQKGSSGPLEGGRCRRGGASDPREPVGHDTTRPRRRPFRQSGGPSVWVGSDTLTAGVGTGRRSTQ